MKCPKCGKRAEVIDSRPSRKTTYRRRRKCSLCHYRYSTIEVTLNEYNILLDFATRYEKINLLLKAKGE